MRRLLVLVLLLAAAAAVALPAGTADARTVKSTVMRKANMASDFSRAKMVALVVRQRGTYGLYLEGRSMKNARRGSAYAIWFLNRRGKARFVGFINVRVRRGRLSSISRLDDRLARPYRIIITRETANRPKSPGRVILRGRFRRGG